MSSEARRRFALFTANFNRKNKRRDAEQRGLLEEPEEEIIFSPMGSRESGGVEMGDFVGGKSKNKDD